MGMLWAFGRYFDDFSVQQLDLSPDEDTGGDHLVVVVEGPPGCGYGHGVGAAKRLFHHKRP